MTRVYFQRAQRPAFFHACLPAKFSGVARRRILIASVATGALLAFPAIAGVTICDTTPDTINCTDNISPPSGTVGLAKIVLLNRGRNGDDGGLFVDATSGKPGPSAPALNVTFHGTVTTVSASAVRVIGRGGNGGSGGSGYAGATSGNGEVGGRGSDITLFNFGSLTTFNDNAEGIFVASIGGNGGSGGDNSISIGHDGGGGGFAGKGGIAFVSNSGNIVTYGSTLSGGIVVQSRGGLGGSGGDTHFSADNSGGTGGNGANADLAQVTNSGTIDTWGTFSNAITTQSIGGFGGDAGSATLGIGTYGGDGQTAGDGARVVVNNTNTLHTRGAQSYGILAQSIGGGGGQGGSASGIATVGGDGGSGGSSGDVTVTNTGQVVTEGVNASAIKAQSIGGGGGDGGDSTGILTVGGKGGSGGNGRKVTVTSSNALTTSGDDSSGIYAQSIGGGGGNGGAATSVSLGFSVAVGGSGAAGGNASTVSINPLLTATSPASTASSITTAGDRSYGVFAQSIGGGGGNGGYALSASVGVAGSVSMAVGGGGGAGGYSDAVDVKYKGAISTSGEGSTGIMAQSIGGGGGNGGMAISVTGSLGMSASAAMGGKGKNGGNGGTAQITSWTDIVTTGENAHGLEAQSIGGGGGNGGMAFSGTATAAGGASLALGGGGEGGGDATWAKIFSYGDLIRTQGANANAIVSQSIGGGGGTGGGALSASLSAGVALSAAAGGSGGKGGSASTADVVNESRLITWGDNSNGLVAQSIGGGGGTGGFSGSLSIGGIAGAAVTLGAGGGPGGNAANVTVQNDGSITTFGKLANAIEAESIGGGGGDGGIAISLAGGGVVSGAMTLGGKGDSGGTGGQVEVTNHGALYTLGEKSYGIFAESLGGGGGNGGLSLAGAATLEGAAMAMALGGEGAAGQDSDTVKVTNFGTIDTRGAASTALLAQSIGGGGGNGGLTGSLAATPSGGGVAASLGRKGGQGGNAKKVTVINDGGNISTTGDLAVGILAQSVGGGGGNGGGAFAASAGTVFGGSLALGGNGAKGGGGQEVEVKAYGDIYTAGQFAHGIQAQSVGGGGGTGGFAISGAFTSGGASVALGGGGVGADGGTSALVDLQHVGSIETDGFGSYGLFAQSVGGGGGSGGFAAALSATTGSVAPALTLGGNGGKGAKAGQVKLKQDGAIYTYGDEASAIVAQSVGGGGGTGGFALSGSLSSQAAIAVGLGGTGGIGGGADLVDVNVKGNLVTFGADAYGLFAQSVGGGGGNGGFAGALSGSNGVGAVAVTLGGNSGSGGEGGEVDAAFDGNLETYGAGSHGIFVQSVGGGGGNGGAAVSLTGTTGNSQQGSIALGGGIDGAGSGGKGGIVTLTVHGTISTDGDDAFGVLAQSVGGGGGNGGLAFSGALSANKSRAASVSLGGKGGAGNNSAKVTFTNYGDISTSGARSTGLFAQSLGGGGGSGGAVGALTLTGSNSIAASVTLGGKGGNGGFAGDVEVTNNGFIGTSGEGAVALQAQSIGGGGGHGGMAGIDPAQFSDYLSGLSASQTFGSKSMSMAFSMGGNGGKGDDAGTVTVTNNGDLATLGDGSNVIFAQSVGGGGGDGGVSGAFAGAIGASGNGSLAIAMGGNGGEAGNGRTVKVTNNGTIESWGAVSTGIYAQSVGGGGGSGGNAKGTAETVNSKKNKDDASLEALSVSVGGTGGAAGNGGLVEVRNTGQIYTAEGLSAGIFAQSVGGGGGDGGSIATNYLEAADLANSIYHAQQGGKATSMTIAVGGTGGASGNGGVVTVDNSGQVFTQGLLAHGIFAQSIGGGGGNGGSGSLGQIDIGGQGTGGGDGGDVTVTNTGQIYTEGAIARGIFAQSVGGGGGNGGATQTQDDAYTSATILNSINYGITASQDLLNLATSLKKPEFGIEIGGMGGTAGDGGKVFVRNDGDIYTQGTLAHGIFAQSVGGGGGTGGEGTIGKLGQITVSGFGGSGGDGKSVTVINTGTIATNGYGAYGIFAQSVGGGGGVAGDISLGITELANIPGVGDYRRYGGLGINPMSGNGGDGGDVTVTNTGDIYVEQAGGIGIFAQSVGGGGGLYGGFLGLGFAGSLGGAGNSGKVVVNQDGNVYAFGINGIGAFLQSDTVHTKGDINATFNGDVYGGSVYGVGVLVDGGVNNTVNLKGWVGAESDLAIRSTIGNDTINLYAGMVGNVDLGTGLNIINNLKDAFIIGGDTLNLGGAVTGTLNNAGYLSAGDLGDIETTIIDGALKQLPGGVIVADVSMDTATAPAGSAHFAARSGAACGCSSANGQLNDKLIVTGKATLGGQVSVNLSDVQLIQPGTHTFNLIDAAGGVTLNSLQLDAPNSAIAKFSLNQSSATRLDLVYQVDFSDLGGDTTPNRAAIGAHINNIQLAGSNADLGPLIGALVMTPDSKDVGQLYDSLSPETYVSAVGAQNASAVHFNDGMMSCNRTFAKSDRCVWGRAEGGQSDVQASSASLGYHQRATRLQGGFEGPAGANLRAGFSIGMESLRAWTPQLTSATGKRLQMGVVAKTEFKKVGIALSWTKGHTWLDTRRYLPFAAAFATARQNIDYDMTALRLSRNVTGRHGYVTPMLDVTSDTIDTDAFSESGVGALGLSVAASHNRVVQVNPSIEFGTSLPAGNAAIKPYVRFGVSRVVAGDAPSVAARLAGTPSAVGDFSVTAPLDQSGRTFQAGVWIVDPKAKGFRAKLDYALTEGAQARDFSVAMKMIKAF
jgi:hypothetical protein